MSEIKEHNLPLQWFVLPVCLYTPITLTKHKYRKGESIVVTINNKVCKERLSEYTISLLDDGFSVTTFPRVSKYNCKIIANDGSCLELISCNNADNNTCLGLVQIARDLCCQKLLIPRSLIEFIKPFL